MVGEGTLAPATSVATSGYAALVLERLAKQACQVVESAACSIFARDLRVPGTAIAVAACGPHEEIVGNRVPLPHRFGETGLGPSEMTLPARSGDEVCGVLVARAPTGSRFGAPELEVLGELATTAGAALGHAERREHAIRSVRDPVRDLIRSIDAHDGYTAGHSEEVVHWCCMVGERLRLSLPDLHELELGALLHDVGKVRLPRALLRKPGALYPAERALVNRHPVWGAELLEGVAGLEPVATVVRFHHERWDGTGYPDGLRRDRIPIASRIIAVCDAYQAMTSTRAYRSALPPAASASQLCAGSGTQFDPAVVDCFVDILKERGWPLGPHRERETARNGGTA
jgi:HD-GYP domain-containing protein (c-di-GMP phosphodiesterase class II)